MAVVREKKTKKGITVLLTSRIEPITKVKKITPVASLSPKSFNAPVVLKSVVWQEVHRYFLHTPQLHQ